MVKFIVTMKLVLLLGGVCLSSARKKTMGPTECFADPAGTESCGGCGQDCQYCGGVFSEETAPRFHLMDQSGCAENDPNGPVFDPVHGVIHHFYQMHAARPGGKGPTYGHFASRDFVAWAALPNAIWNGYDYSQEKETPWDGNAIYTGSAALVPGAAPDGVSEGVVQIYPGLCKDEQWDGCEATTGTVLAQAVPADYAGDPLLTKWRKPDYNPIFSTNVQRDPSNPWKTEYGEWRLRTYDAKIYAASSDEHLLNGSWYEVGSSTTLRQCECPSLYELPRLTPGFEDDSQRALPTHVHKTSCTGDWWQLGTYVEGAPGVVGTFSATPGWEDLFEQRRVDQGFFYASKDALYPPGNRRINWGWAQVDPAACQSLPREITFNPAARRLEQSPIPELVALREDEPSVNVTPAARYSSEEEEETERRSLRAETVAFTLPSRHSEVVVRWAVSSLVDTSVDVSLGVCATCTLSLFSSTLDVACQNFQDSLPVVDGEETLEFRVFADATFLEVFVQNGRVAMLLKCSGGVLDDNALVSVTGPEPTNLLAFNLRSIWVTPDDVLDAPRVF